MVAVPAVTPLTTPVVPTTVAFALPLLQVPPPLSSFSPMVPPAHTLPLPAIGAGNEFMVTVYPTAQPVADNLYVMPAVPAVTPVTLPEPSTEANDVLLHVPPAVASVSAIEEFWQTKEGPDMEAGNALTVTVAYTAPLEAKEKVINAVPAEIPVTFPEPSTLA